MRDMVAIRYEAPQSIGEAVRLMEADPGAHVLAGGTDLLVQFRAGVRRPSAFVDIKLASWKRIGLVTRMV